MEDRSSRRPRTLVTPMAQRGLSANELSGALISMMARSTRFNQRPDTLMQDRHRQTAELSCNARPDHTLGQWRRCCDVRDMSDDRVKSEMLVCGGSVAPTHRHALREACRQLPRRYQAC